MNFNYNKHKIIIFPLPSNIAFRLTLVACAHLLSLSLSDVNIVLKNVIFEIFE